jgi:ABC-type glycerol-3-phosphate transport system substrate-binding protein
MVTLAPGEGLRSKITRRRALRGAGLAAVAAAALGTAACGAGAGGGDGAAPAKKPVKLVFEWPTYTPPKQEWAEHAMKTYSQKFPHVTVEPMWNTNPTEKLTTTLAGGQPPDVGWFGVGHWNFHQAFRPIEDFLKTRRISTADYLPKVVEAMKWRGKMLAFPMGINTSAVFMNKALFQKAGVTLFTDEHTWDDLITQGKRLTGGEGAAKVFATNAAYYSLHWAPAYGGAWLDADATKVLVNNPQTLKVMTLLRDLWEKHGVQPTPQQNRDIATPGTATSATAGFTTARYASAPAGTWGIDPGRKESWDWDICEVPTLVDGGRKYKGAFCGTEEIFVVKGGPNEEAAADFAAWLISPEHLTWASNKGHIIPTHLKTAQSAFVNPPGESRPKNIQAFVRAAAYAPPIIGHPEYAKLNGAWAAAANKWYGAADNPQNTLTAEQALREAQTEMQRVLDDWNRANPK